MNDLFKEKLGFLEDIGTDEVCSKCHYILEDHICNYIRKKIYTIIKADYVIDHPTLSSCTYFRKYTLQ
jgi:hypothetical protein